MNETRHRKEPPVRKAEHHFHKYDAVMKARIAEYL